MHPDGLAQAANELTRGERLSELQSSLSSARVRRSLLLSLATMFLVDWILRLSFRCYSLDRSWPYPVDGRMMEHLCKEQERQLLQKERRREATELEMELLLCYRAGFGVEYIAPAVKAVVEVVVPNGVDERVGKGIEEVQRLAQSCECDCQSPEYS